MTMHSPSLISTLYLLAVTALISSSNAASIQSREDSPIADPPTSGLISTFKSSTGDDLTGNFQTMFYDGSVLQAESNFTERGLPTVRLIDACRRRDAIFYHSECTYNPSVKHSLQDYRVKCVTLNPVNPALGQSVAIEVGRCTSHEICVNGPRTDEGMPTMASCVQRNRFERVPLFSSSSRKGRFEKIPKFEGVKGKEKVEQILSGKTASAVVSQMDGQRAMSVESLELDAGVGGAAKVGGALGYHTGQGKCSNCVDVATEKLQDGTDLLASQITVSTAGAAVAGILWIAVMSG